MKSIVWFAVFGRYAQIFADDKQTNNKRYTFACYKSKLTFNYGLTNFTNFFFRLRCCCQCRILTQNSSQHNNAWTFFSLCAHVCVRFECIHGKFSIWIERFVHSLSRQCLISFHLFGFGIFAVRGTTSDWRASHLQCARSLLSANTELNESSTRQTEGILKFSHSCLFTYC